jgi:hypothetical protein
MARKKTDEIKRPAGTSAGSDGGWSAIMGGALVAFALVLALAAASIAPPTPSGVTVAADIRG